jgi:hypothetical protein
MSDTPKAEPTAKSRQTMTSKTAKLLSKRQAPGVPLTEKEQDIVLAIREYHDDVAERFGREAAWICAVKLQEHYGLLVGHALGFVGVIIPHTFHDHRERHVRIVDGK